jgi:Flp pilus assembly protein TadD
MSTAETKGAQLRLWVLAGTILLVLATLFIGYQAMRWGPSDQQDEFAQLSNVGKNYLDKGDGSKAIAPFEKALALRPNDTNALLNLANAHLAASQPEQALALARRAKALDPNSGAAHFLEGCAALRLGQLTNAVQALQQAKHIDQTVNAVTFQLGRAYQQLGQYEAALREFQELVQFEPEHQAAHYNLSQMLLRLGRTEEAQQALQTHQKLVAGKSAQVVDPSVFEQCRYTQANAPFLLEQPALRGISVAFADATAETLGEAASRYLGPVGVLDLNHDGQLGLFVREGPASFRWLTNVQGRFQPSGEPIPTGTNGGFTRCLVGDLNNDRVEDILVLGESSCRAFKFSTNGPIMDITMFARLQQVTAKDGVLVDLDFTGKLDLITLSGASNAVRVLRNLGQPYFIEFTTNAGLPFSLTGATQVAVEDFNSDDLLDLLVARPGEPPLFYTKQRGATLALSNSPAAWPSAERLAAGDVNNDMQVDLVTSVPGQITILRQSCPKPEVLDTPGFAPRLLLLVDYDSDGWLDLLAGGVGIRLWRNLGESGFREVTDTVGLKQGNAWSIQSIHPADLDLDGDTDLLLALESGELKVLRNEGGNAHHQLKIHLVGTRSNASGLGIRLEVTAGGLRLARRVQTLPIEIGVGTNGQVNSITAHWFDFSLSTVDVKVEAQQLVSLLELQINTGSCPYLYAWTGEKFEFVTDVLGSAPLGLPINEERLVEADPFEYIWLGDTIRFPPRTGSYTVQITEELREALYLDEAKLAVVDHPAGTEVHTTCKMLPAKPFPQPGFVTLHQRLPLRQAVTHQGHEVTEALQVNDGRMVSPACLRIPQLRSLAEPHSVTLDFGPLPTQHPLVLALTGWLRFGGGMANVAASHDPSLPFPFPTLEVETQDGAWRPVLVEVGTPAGKTKTIVVDLSGKLPEGSRRLRLVTAYEIHWDRIALFEKADPANTQIQQLEADRADLHWRGFSELKDLPWYYPLTPDYQRVNSAPPWKITPTGWCTRYGPVDPLLHKTDNALALLNGGDELTLEFQASRLPALGPGMTRDFFLYLVGWDKDSDFHCRLGWLVEPLPWHGIDDQQYGRQTRPSFPSDQLMEKFNTRWVGPRTLARKGR